MGAETQIEDLWLRYFCVVTNVGKMDTQIYSRGSLWRFVRASMTVLGLFPPMIVDGEVFTNTSIPYHRPVE